MRWGSPPAINDDWSEREGGPSTVVLVLEEVVILFRRECVCVRKNPVVLHIHKYFAGVWRHHIIYIRVVVVGSQNEQLGIVRLGEMGIVTAAAR